MSAQQIRFCTSSDGVRVAFASGGDGPPLVKAANWISHLERDLGSPVWSPLLRALMQRHRLVRYDQRGCGLSDWDVPSMSFDDWVADLETVVDHLGLKRFPLLGISLGASIAIAYAARHPERVSHLVLYGGYARGRLHRQPSAQAREEAELLARLAEIGWGRPDLAFRQFFTTQFIPQGTPEQQAWFNELQQLSTSPANAARMMRVSDQIDVTSLLAQVRCPVLVLHSDHDARVPFEEGRLLAGEIPHASFVPLHSPNHLLLASEPAWPVWLQAVNDFLPSVADPAWGKAFEALTPRERELLALLAQGHDNAALAAALALSEKTVRNHVSSVYAKLGVRKRAEAVVLARRAGLGQGEPGTSIPC